MIRAFYDLLKFTVEKLMKSRIIDLGYLYTKGWEEVIPIRLVMQSSPDLEPML